MSTSAGPTQVLCRQTLIERVDQQVTACRQSGERFALLVFNLNKFRDVNLDFGHQVGDVLLQQFAERIWGVLRPDDMLFHIGNDEFAAILTQLKTPQVVELAITRILELVGRNYEIAGSMVGVTAVAGAAIYPDHAADRDALLKATDAALQYADARQLTYCIYDRSVRRADEKLADLTGNLRIALDSSELSLHYQPQIDLQQGTLSGCEALARWQHAEQGWIRPDLFVPVAEKNGLIDTLTYWSVNVALREWFTYCGSCPAAAIAINLSAKLLQSTEVVELIRRALNIWGAEPGALVLEVTESAMMCDPRAALHTLRALHDMGITLSIDDFGTGYSSLAYLKELPVGELKIDKSFVQQMAEYQQDRKIVQAIIDLAHNLGMRVVAEGIENQQTLDMLIGMGCDHGQGFYIGRPMPIGELPPWMEGGNWSKSGIVSE